MWFLQIIKNKECNVFEKFKIKEKYNVDTSVFKAKGIKIF